MPAFLILERDGETAERLRRALNREGWQGSVVDDLDAV